MTTANETMRTRLESSLKEAPFARVDDAEVRVELHSKNKLHIEVVSPSFLGKSNEDRNEEVWPLIEKLGDEYVLSVSLCMLLTPAEAEAIRSVS